MVSDLRCILKVWVLVKEFNFNKGIFFFNLHVLWLTIKECNRLFQLFPVLIILVLRILHNHKMTFSLHLWPKKGAQYNPCKWLLTFSTWTESPLFHWISYCTICLAKCETIMYNLWKIEGYRSFCMNKSPLGRMKLVCSFSLSG